MISTYFKAPWTLERMRSGCVGPYIDDFADALAGAGHTPHTIRGHIRAAVHIGRWADCRGIDLASWDDDILTRFRRHLMQCRCNKRSKGIFSHALASVAHLLAFLRTQQVIVPAKPAEPLPRVPAIAERFATWMLRHRGAATSTVRRFQLVLARHRRTAPVTSRATRPV